MAIENWPAALRRVNVSAQMHNGFPNTPKPNGDLPDRIDAFYWHHDATPVGPTPGGLGWLITEYNKGNPSAQIWIDYGGVWHFAGAGVASHAGVVRGSLTNKNTVGGETDHTVNEAYPTLQLESIRKGIAAISVEEGRDSDFMTFHKIEAVPFGRKVDPWFDGVSNDLGKWQGELQRERNIIQAYINDIKSGTAKPPTDNNPSGDGELSAADADRVIAEIHYGNDKVMNGQNGEAPDHNIRQIKEEQANQARMLQHLDDLISRCIMMVDALPKS